MKEDPQGEWVLFDDAFKEINTIYRCSICGRVIGTREKGTNINLANFTIRATPTGVGSGLYCSWICCDCDKDKFDSYIEMEGLSFLSPKHPWMIAK